ncbi:MAG: lysophospholipid acyltransferase family protein [Myxococcales bacterium]|nr:lysophospholipid acyltransferase family protein [Myxococcales bacterium]
MGQGAYLLFGALILAPVAVFAVQASGRRETDATATGARLPFLFRAAKYAGAVLGSLVGGLLRVRRRHVEDSLSRSGLDPQQAGAMYRRLGRGVFELLWLSLPGKRALRDVVLIDPELLPWLDSPRGLVVATAHTGNWDLTACAAASLLSARERRLTVVTKHFSHGWLDRTWQGLRRKYGVDLISAGSVWGEARRSLPRGNVVAMMIDQAPERSRGSAPGRFMGQPCVLDLGPCLVAGRLGVPLIAVFAARDADGRQVLRLAGCASPPKPGEPLRAWAEATAQTLNDWLEVQVRRDPADWLWMHRRWKPLPGAAPQRRMQRAVSDGSAEISA